MVRRKGDFRCGVSHLTVTHQVRPSRQKEHSDSHTHLCRHRSRSASEHHNSTLQFLRAVLAADSVLVQQHVSNVICSRRSRCLLRWLRSLPRSGTFRGRARLPYATCVKDNVLHERLPRTVSYDPQRGSPTTGEPAGGNISVTRKAITSPDSQWMSVHGIVSEAFGDKKTAPC